MRQPTTASSLAGATRVRTIVVAILAMAAGILMAGQARPAHADHGRTFGFLTHQATVDEGEALVLDVIVGGNSSSPAVIVGFNIDLATAEAGDVQGDFCLNVPSGAVSLIQQVSISTFADTDTADATFTVAITFDDEAINGCTPNAGPVGHQAQPAGQMTVDVTINDTGGGGGDNTFEFATTGSSGEEGDTVTVDVIRSGDLDGPASVDCNVVGGTAEGSDYDVVDGTANFGDNDSTGACQFELLADADPDLIETILLRLQDPSSGHVVVEPDEHTITIVDPDTEVIQFSHSSYTVDEDAGTASFTITRTNPDGDDTVVCRTVELTGEADEDVDYEETDDVLNFTGSATSRTCTVPIIPDGAQEDDETFGLMLDHTSGNATLGPNDEAVVTILDADDNTFAFESATYTVNENAGTVTITVVRSSSAGTGSVDWDITGGTATAGVDYVDASGTVSFSNGELEDTFTITILATAALEPNETIIVSLEDPVSGDIVEPDQTVVTITEFALPTVTDVTPDNIPVAGGASVVITGTNFSGATAVTFGGVNATSFVVNNATQITAVAPARPAGTYDVRVTTPGGTSANTVNDNITYGAADSVTYQLVTRWSLIAWLGRNNASIPAALQGTVALTDGLAQTAPNNIFNTVTAVATWNNSQQRYLFWFPTGSTVPGANDITTFQYGTPYWIAVTQNVNWTVVEGP